MWLSSQVFLSTLCLNKRLSDKKKKITSSAVSDVSSTYQTRVSFPHPTPHNKTWNVWKVSHGKERKSFSFDDIRQQLDRLVWLSRHFFSAAAAALSSRMSRHTVWFRHMVSPVRSTHDQCTCTRQASDMTCDSDVIEKPSRRWRGAVQQLADVVWESWFSCDYPCSRNRESNFFLTDLLTFFFVLFVWKLSNKGYHRFFLFLSSE